jgi:iron complex outermembrane receptor protein
MTRAHLLTGTSFCLTAIALFGSATSASAQQATSNVAGTAATGQVAQADQPSTDTGDILVTARRREERLLDVPISIQTLSAAQLAEDRITNLDTLQYEAGFTFNSQGASFFGGGREFPTLVFRGMSSNYGSGRADSGALFIDGIYISGGSASVTLADASRVEVLKGPQSVYFGKNTFGGAVNLITANPTESYHGSFSAGYSNKGSYDDVASVEGAIIPGLLTARLTGELLHQGAQYKAADGGSLGKEDTKGVTAVLYATPASGVWLRGRFHYSHDNDSPAADGFISGATYGTACPGFASPYLCNGVPSLDVLNSKQILSGTTIPAALLTAVASNNFGGVQGLLINKVPTENQAGLVRDNIQASVQGGISLPKEAEFQFSVGYNQQKSLDITSSDHTPANAFTSAYPFITHDLDVDGRIVSDAHKPLRLLLGFNYFQSLYQSVYDGYYFALFENSNPTNEKEKTFAAYGSVEYDFFPALTLSGELRYQSDTISDSALDGQPAYLVGNISKTYRHALPRVILRYHPGNDLNLYVSYSKGVQPPQLQVAYIEGDSYTKAALTAQAGGGNFTSDPTLRAWEVGAKKSFFHEKVFLSLAYFNQYWDNALALTYFFNNPANNCPSPLAAGISAACPYSSGGASAFSVSQNHIQGIEFEGTVKVTPKLTAHAMVNWTDAIRNNYYDNSFGGAFTAGVAPPQNGNRLDLVPVWQAAGDLSYKSHLTGPYDWYARGVVTYTGSQYADPTDIAKISDYTHVNLSLGVTRGKISLEGYVSNLFNDKNWSYAVRFPDPAYFFGEAHQGVIAAAPNPRDFGFRLSGRF